MASRSDFAQPARAARRPEPGRSAARLAAAMALYQRDMAGGDVEALVAEFRVHRLGAQLDEEVRLRAADGDFFADIVRGVAARGTEIDGLIGAALADGWSLERLDRPLLAVLRAATFELLARPDAPAGAIIDEYLEVTKALGDRSQVSFANAVLDRVAREARAPA